MVDEECILPDDDDDLRIGVEPQIRPPNLALPPNITPVILRANTSHPKSEISPMIRRFQSASEQNVAPEFSQTITDGNKTLHLKRVTSLPEILSAKKQKFATKAVQQQTSVATNSATISLDSDDEESALPVAPINTPQPQAVRTTNVNGNQCIVIPASAFQEILKRVQSTPANPNMHSTQQTIPPVTPSTSKAQLKIGDKFFIPSSKKSGPASKTSGPASKTSGPASKTSGPTVEPASKTIGPASKTRTAKAIAATMIATPAKATPAPPVREQTPPKQPSPKKYADIAISSSSESERSRSPSPTDPMSILRNVVHIQADPNPATPKPSFNVKPAARSNPFAGHVPAKQTPAPNKSSATPTKPTPAPTKPNPTSSHSKNTRSNQPTKPTPPKTPQPSNSSVRPLQPKLKMADNVKVKTLDARIAAKTAQIKSAQPSTSRSTKNTKDDSNYRLLGSFDLTDLPEDSVSKTPANKPGPSTSSAKQRSKETAKPTTTTTITGKSRDIILTPGNKTGVKALTKEPRLVLALFIIIISVTRSLLVDIGLLLRILLYERFHMQFSLSRQTTSWGRRILCRTKSRIFWLQ